LRGKTLVLNYYPPYQDPSFGLKKNRYGIQRWHEALDKPKCPPYKEEDKAVSK
jgi:hypothetical protein